MRSTNRIGTYWIAMYVNGSDITYFDSFGVEYIPNEIKKLIGNKNITTNIYRIQAFDSIMWGRFIIKGKKSVRFYQFHLPLKIMKGTK